MQCKMRAVLALMLLVTANSSLRAQERDISGLSWNGMPHPVSAALGYWDTLNLSEAQITRLREISDRLETKVFSLMAPWMPDTTKLWRFWSVEPFDSAALVREGHAKVDAEAGVTIAMLRARDDVFRVLSRTQAELLRRLVRERVTGDSSRPVRGFCRAGSGMGGGASISDAVWITYTIDFSEDSAHIGAVIVGRADTKIYQSGNAGPRPDLPGASNRTGGGTVGRWWLLHDWGLDVVWIDTQRVPLNGNNIVLLQGVDRLTRRPDVVGLVRVPKSFPLSECTAAGPVEELKKHLLQHPEVRAFIERRPS